MVVLPLFIDIKYVEFHKTLRVMSISTNIYRLYMRDPLGQYILLFDNTIDLITLIGQLINYLYQLIVSLIAH